jgi:4-alpha-glucanotransferase
MNDRASGILLHPTSLPARGGIGDLGPAAYEFVDFLAAARQGLWQILPLHPPGLGNSPYSAISAFAGNPLLVSLERLAERRWIERKRLASLPEQVRDVNYDYVRATKLPLLREAAQNFLEHANGSARARYQRFCAESAWWLEDFVLFEALRRRYQSEAWNRWPQEIARREPGALQRTRDELRTELDLGRVIQFAFFEQWRALHSYGRARAIRIIGDVAIFVNFDSADVWVHRDIFRLDDHLEPEVVAGVPPDAFSVTGQRWGNPLYRWDVLQQRGYDWWIQRMRWAAEMCDIVRLDHFRGFEKNWEIPASAPTAVHGRWVDGPKDDLFHALRNALGGLPFIAEDLGFITAEVHALRQRLQIPGMRVMQFGFGNPGAHIYLPHKFEPNTVVYTGTHDNDTTIGWWNTMATPDERRAVEAYFGIGSEGVNWAFIRAAEGSVARCAIIPLQDVLGLDSSGRMNTPSLSDGNWAWRYQPDALAKELAERMAKLVEVADRAPEISAAAEQRDREAGEDFAA